MPETIEAKVSPKPVFYDFLQAFLLELTERGQTEFPQFPIKRRAWHEAFYKAIKKKLIPPCRTELTLFPYVHSLEEGIYRLMQAGHISEKGIGRYSITDINALKRRQDCFEADQQDRLKTTAKYICDKISETP